ncbi:MAG: hypothetical protein ABSD31_15985, partial [Candidatus Binataceae bacterium]
SGDTLTSSAWAFSTFCTITYSSHGVYPEGIGIDASDNVWISNRDTNNVVELSRTGKFIQSITVGIDPHGLKIDRANSGNIWSQNQGGGGPGAPSTCPDGTTGTVTALAPTGTVVGSFCTQGDLPQHAQFDASDNIWVTNQGSNTISELVAGNVGIGTFVASFPTGVNPHAVARDQNGNFWIGNYGSADITVLNSLGDLVSTIAGVGPQPTGNDIDPSANLWQSVAGLHVVKEFAAAPSFVQIGGDHPAGNTPRGVTIDNAGNVFVANQNSENVFKFNSSGRFVREFKVGRGAENMAINSKGDVWVTNAYDNTVTVLEKVAVPTPNNDDDSNG